jgi:hypothetical protein
MFIDTVRAFTPPFDASRAAGYCEVHGGRRRECYHESLAVDADR